MNRERGKPGDPCLCGCGRPILRQRRNFATRACYWNMVRCGRYPDWRRRRLETFNRNAAKRAERFASKPEAYTKGYRAGYRIAWHYWRAKYRRVVEQNEQLRKGRAA